MHLNLAIKLIYNSTYSHHLLIFRRERIYREKTITTVKLKKKEKEIIGLKNVLPIIFYLTT